MRDPTRGSWEGINIDERREKLNYEVEMLPEAWTDQCESRTCVSMTLGVNHRAVRSQGTS